ncbi:rho GTPase activating protein at 18B [Glossina fuscipes fuscipes]
MLKMSKEEHLNRVYKNKKNKVSYADNGGGKTARNNNNQELYNNNNSVYASKQRDSNNKIDDNHFTVERSKNKSATLNSGYRSLATEPSNETLDSKCLAETSCREYENVNFTDLHLLDKKLLLQKYFRSALVGPRSNVYENLCRGCNYGVFTARGPLCTFCECIVSGVPAVNESSYNSSTNIYENICEQCNQIYSANEDHCNCLTAPKSINNFGNKSKHKSVEHLESLAIKQKVKVKKSKSFNKTDNKRKILSNFLDNWKRNKSSDSVSSKISSKKSLEIVHNVEGYDQVFHTQETFDLQRMCELKRSETSHSDQHIYGRLKQSDFIAKNSHTLPPQLAQTTQNTHTPLQKSLTSSTNSTTSSGEGSKSSNSIKSSGKRPRISKPRLLRLRSSSSSSQAEIQESHSEEKQSLYLPDSVCQWMTSLRREIYNYSTHGLINNDDSSDVYSLCYPKSIPAKNSLIYNQAPMTNYPNIKKKLHEFEFHNDEQYTEDDDNSDSESLDSAKNVLLRNQRNDISSLEFIQRSTPSNHHHYQRMVQEFKLNLLINKEMHSSCNGSCKNVNTFGKNNNKVSLSSSSSSSSSTGVDSLTMPLSRVVGSCLREPAANNRNNIYLKLSEGTRFCMKDTEKRVDNNEEHGNALFKYRGMAYVDSEDYTAVSHPLPLQVDGSVCCNVARKRHGIHERNSEFVNDILTVFENLLQRDKQMQDHKILDENHLENHSSSKEAHLNDTLNVGVARNNETIFDHTLQISNTLQPYVATKEHIVSGTNTTLTQIFDLVHLINNLWLSLSLNIVTIYYDKTLKVFLHCIAQTKQICNERRSYNQLVRKYQQFHSKYKLKQLRAKSSIPVHKCRSLNVELDFNETNGQFCGNANSNEPITAIEEINCNNKPKIQHTFNDLNQESICMKSIRLNSSASVLTSAPVTSVDVNKKLKIPPQVPKRDPKTHLCSNFKNKFEDTSLIAITTTTTTTTTTTMTVPTNNSSSNTRNRTVEDDSIYQPIWKFKTVGDVPDMDYYEMNASATKDTNIVKLCQNTKDDDSSLIPEILISCNDHDHVEDHNEWETDDEFMFTTQLEEPNFSSSVPKGAIYSHHSSNSSSIGDRSLSGSTVTGFASSTATLASALSYSLSHHLFRSVGIFYSVTELKLRAIVYDYDRVQASLYFAKSEIPSNKSILYNTNNTNNDDSGIGKTPSPSMSQKNYTSSPVLLSSVSQVSQREIPSINSESACHDIIQQQSQQPQRYLKQQQLKTETLYSLPDCVQAWKFQLLDVNYAEDEEDMIVSECEILRAQEIKEDIESRQTHQQNILQRFKSISSGNLIDIPVEDDKKTIAERMRNKLQRGVFKINVRSPKSEKKTRGLFRRTETASLYLEDGLKPKYPIFGAALDQLELNQTTYPNVPRFVVDCVEYIENKDRIVQDGLYRACGNKFSIDELKQKLTESYIYDPKLLIADDIHTITSLLKQFFRELGAPLIPQEIYERLGRNLSDEEGIETIRKAFEDMKEPNRSTLTFVIKHLTNVAAFSSSNRMNASNLAIVWGPCLLSASQIDFDIGRMNTFAKVLIENYEHVFSPDTNERLVC